MAKNTEKQGEQKTNVMRLLDKEKIPYRHHCYADTDAVSGLEVAAVLGQDIDRVFKTLVAVGRSGEHYVFVVPVSRELDLRKAAKTVNEKSVEMIHVKDINKIIVPLSTIGLRWSYPIVLPGFRIKIICGF